MRPSVKLIATAIALVLARGVFAADPQAAESLAKAGGCFACHSIDKKLVGPAYKDVAAKYRNDKGAEAKLIKKVRMGGKASGVRT